MRAVREGLPKSVAFVANGDIQEHGDFAKVMEMTGARAGMSGYGALLDPGGFLFFSLSFFFFFFSLSSNSFVSAVFAPKEIRPSQQQIIQDYLDLARKHRNLLIDVQRHLAWLLKRTHADKNIKVFLKKKKKGL